eukprot:5116173-Ditylum_brightwellii.AAC.1
MHGNSARKNSSSSCNAATRNCHRILHYQKQEQSSHLTIQEEQSPPIQYQEKSLRQRSCYQHISSHKHQIILYLVTTTRDIAIIHQYQGYQLKTKINRGKQHQQQHMSDAGKKKWPSIARSLPT